MEKMGGLSDLPKKCLDFWAFLGAEMYCFFRGRLV